MQCEGSDREKGLEETGERLEENLTDANPPQKPLPFALGLVAIKKIVSALS